MPGVKRNTAPRTFLVEISFDGLNKGDRFTLNAEDLANPASLGWALQHVGTGYLRDVSEDASEEVSADERGTES